MSQDFQAWDSKGFARINIGADLITDQNGTPQLVIFPEISFRARTNSPTSTEPKKISPPDAAYDPKPYLSLQKWPHVHYVCQKILELLKWLEYDIQDFRYTQYIFRTGLYPLTSHNTHSSSTDDALLPWVGQEFQSGVRKVAPPQQNLRYGLFVGCYVLPFSTGLLPLSPVCVYITLIIHSSFLPFTAL